MILVDNLKFSYIYRDLKPENIVVTNVKGNIQLKVTDFG